MEIKDIKWKFKMLPEERKEGIWNRIGRDIYECTICGQMVMTGDIVAYQYCHGCGAKMERRTDE